MHQSSEPDHSQGQGAAIEQLFSQHYNASLRTAYRILRSREDAEDAVQTAYHIAFRHLSTFRRDSSFNTWVTRIVVNCCLAHLRQLRSRMLVGFHDVERTLSLAVSQSLTPEELCYQGEMQSAQYQAASQLSPDLRDVYAPCAIAGAGYAEVARKLGLTRAAAKSRLFRARRIVQHTLRAVTERRAA
jgi:RNA polymerase sigma factor (sigma-70 family)